jgi:hypothetical protein
MGLENPSLLVFGVVDVLATLWTVSALREERRGQKRARASQADEP